MFHVRAVWIYAALLIVWRTATVLHDGGTGQEAAIVALWLVLLPIGASLILGLLAYATAASTVYTLTDRRLVMRIGIALTLTLNLPFRAIAAADYKSSLFGTGEIAISLAGSDRISYLVLWPHARPWRVRKPQPMLRAVPDGVRVAGLIARALAEAARQPARPLESPAPTAAPERARVRRPAALAG